MFTAELMDIAGLWDLNKELLYLLVFVWSPRSDYLGKTGKKNRKKIEKNGMHWNMALDALPGSATIGPLA